MPIEPENPNAEPKPIESPAIDVPSIPIPDEEISGQFVVDPSGRRLMNPDGKFFIHHPEGDPCCQEPSVPCGACIDNRSPARILLSISGLHLLNVWDSCVHCYVSGMTSIAVTLERQAACTYVYTSTNGCSLINSSIPPCTTNCQLDYNRTYLSVIFGYSIVVRWLQIQAGGSASITLFEQYSGEQPHDCMSPAAFTNSLTQDLMSFTECYFPTVPSFFGAYGGTATIEPA